MKYVIFMSLLIIVTLSGCSLDYYDYDISSVPYFDTWQEYHEWFRENIEYQRTGSGMYNPEIVLQCGYGECDSLSLCLGYIIETRLGIDVKGVELDNDGKYPHHACIEINGKLIEPLRTYDPVTDNGYWIVDYWEIGIWCSLSKNIYVE